MVSTKFILRSEQRVFFAGKTGSGKSFLARFLLASMRRLIVIDPKISPAINKWNLQPWDNDGLKLLRDGENARLRIFNPPEVDREGYPVWDQVFLFAWEIGDVCIYIDEMGSVAKDGRMSWPLRRQYTQGREHGIGTWAATQRPSHVPLEMFSESEWGVVFMLKMEDDRKRIARNTGYDEILLPIRDKHGFYVYYETWPNAVYYEQFEPHDRQFERTEWKEPQPRKIERIA